MRGDRFCVLLRVCWQKPAEAKAREELVASWEPAHSGSSSAVVESQEVGLLFSSHSLSAYWIETRLAGDAGMYFLADNACRRACLWHFRGRRECVPCLLHILIFSFLWVQRTKTVARWEWQVLGGNVAIGCAFGGKPNLNGLAWL